MGIKCKINRVGDTISVSDNKELYEDLLAYFKGDQKKALDYWSVSFTEDFRNSPDFRDSKMKSGIKFKSTLSNLTKSQIELVGILENTGLASEVIFLTDKEMLRERGLDENLPGHLMGFVKNRSTVYFNKDYIASETLVHEFGHLWYNWAARNEPEILKEGKELIKKYGKSYFDYINKHQPELQGDSLLEEVLIQAIGEKGAKLVEDQGKSSFRRWLDRLWDSISEFFGIKNIEDKRLDEFTTKIASKLIKGEYLGQSNPFASGRSVTYLNSVFKGESLETSQPTINQVLTYLNNKEETSLDEIGKEEAFNASIGNTFGSLQDYYELIYPLFFTEGRFEINVSKLKSSGIYTDGEINMMKSDSEIQSRIKTNILKLGNTPEVQIPSVDSNFDFSVKDNLNGFGKLDLDNPNEVEAILRQEVGGITNLEDFTNESLKSSIDGYAIKISEDDGFLKKMYNHFSKYKRIPKYVERNGTLLQDTTSETFKTLENTLDSVLDISKVENTLDYLIDNTDDFIWDGSYDIVPKLLKNIERNAAKNGIDLLGLEDTYFLNSREDILEVLESYRNIIEKVEAQNVTEADLLEFSKSWDNLKGVSTPENVEVQKVPTYLKNKSLVSLETELDDNIIFEQEGMIKVGESLYHNVDKMDNVEGAYEVLLEVVQENPTLVPQEAVSFAVTKDGLIDYSKVRSQDNYEILRKSLKDYILRNRKEDSENLAVHKSILGYPLGKLSISPKIYEVNTSFEGDSQYLSTDFISDFYKDYLKEKEKNSTLYNKVFRHFNFNDKGVTLRNKDPYTLEVIKINTEDPRFDKFKEYTKIHKDFVNLNMYPSVEELDSETREDLKAINNPTTIDEVSGVYKIEGNTIIVKNGEGQRYIKPSTSKNVYKKIDYIGDLNIYQRITPDNVDPNFLVTKPREIEKDTDFNELAYVDMWSKNPDIVTKSTLYSKKESEEINKKIDKC